MRCLFICGGWRSSWVLCAGALLGCLGGEGDAEQSGGPGGSVVNPGGFGASSGSPSTSDSVQSKSQYLQALVVEACAWSERCSRETNPLLGDRCTTLLLDAVLAQDSEAVVLDAAAANACLTAVRTATDCFEVRAAGATHCGEALAGTLRIGSPCANFNQCVSDARCDLSQSCPGSCVSEPEEPGLQLGAPCDPFGAGCEANLTCDISTQTCRNYRDVYRKGSAGAACTDDEYCELGLYCSWASNTCQPLRGEGEACDDDGQCAAAYFCSPLAQSPRFCVAKLPDGAQCTISSQCSSGRCAESRCVQAATSGDACSSDEACVTGYCGDGICAKQPQCYGFIQGTDAAGPVGVAPAAPPDALQP